MGKSLKHIFAFAATVLAMLLVSCGQKADNSVSSPIPTEIALNDRPSLKSFSSHSHPDDESSVQDEDIDDYATDFDESEGRVFMVRGHEERDSLSD